MLGLRSSHIFPIFVLTVAGVAFIPNPGWFAGTFVGWLVFGGLLIAGQLAMVAYAGTLPVLSVLVLSALVAGAEYGLPMETGLPLLAVAAVMASQSRLPEGKWFARIVGMIASVWLLAVVYGWWTLGIAPAETHWGFIKFFSPEWPGESGWPRLEWPLGNANPMAGLLLMLVPLGVALTIAEVKAKLWRTPWAISTLLAAGLLAACGSRAGLLAPVVAAFAYLLFLPAARLRTRVKIFIVGVVVATLGGFIAISPVYRQRILNPDSQSYSDQIRRDFAETGLNMVRANPLSGVGAGGIPAHYAAYLSASSDQPGCHQLHCTPLQWAAEFGIGGGLIWLGLAVLTIVGLRKAARAEDYRVLRGGAAVAATAYLVFSLFDYQLYLPVTAFIWGACIGLTWVDFALKPVSARAQKALIAGVLLVSILTARQVVSGATARYQWRQASKLLVANDIKAALDRMGLAMEAAPDSPVYPAVAATWIATLPAGDAKAAAQNREMADALLTKARRNAPDFPYLAALQGWLWVDSEPAKAVPLFHEALLRSPKLPAAWQGLARAYARQGKQGAAITALALNGMIVSEDLFSPSLRTGFFRNAAPIVSRKFKALASAYGQDFPEDASGNRRLASVLRQVEAWDAAHGQVALFIGQNPDWSVNPIWRYLASVDMKKGPDGLYPLRSRMIMTSALYSVTSIEGKDGHAISLLNACGGLPDVVGFEDVRVLNSQETFGGFGLYLGDATLGLHPFYSAETDLLASVYVFESDPVRAHLRSAFFLKILKSLESAK